ncbi:MAG: hypothetical protein WC498_03595 [Candidatus Saccharimonadales bacterium]
MSAALLALLASVSGGVWVYVRLQRQTGSGNNKSAAIGAVVAGVIGFVVVFTVSKMILK